MTHYVLLSGILQNLFDTVDDPEINDEDFLPNGEMEWTEDRLDKKMYNLSKNYPYDE